MEHPQHNIDVAPGENVILADKMAAEKDADSRADVISEDEMADAGEDPGSVKHWKDHIVKIVAIGSVVFFLGVIVGVITQLSRPFIVTNNIVAHADKPIVYLYPEQIEDIDIHLENPGRLICSYPRYQDGWFVTARPDGSLTDADGRNLYALYYEAQTTVPDSVYGNGFVVAGNDSASFLEEKLSDLGLNERESEEFIVYWLPKLEANKYNFIHFLTMAEIDNQMGLDITPEPDTMIRVWMAFEGLDAPADVSEQQFPSTPERNGFTVVEWGGIELQST